MADPAKVVAGQEPTTTRANSVEALTSFTVPLGAGVPDRPVQVPSPTLFLAVGVCSVSPLLFGFSISFTSPAQKTMLGEMDRGVWPPPHLVVLSESTFGWYASVFNIGAMAGAWSGSTLGDNFGRRAALAFTAVPHLVAWVCTALGTGPRTLIAMRLLCGWAVGMGTAVTPCYIGEIATDGLRGALGACNQLSITLGIFGVNWLGSRVFTTESGDAALFCHWRRLAWFGAALSMTLLLMLRMPESPQWLAKSGDLPAASAALARLRAGDVAAEAELLRAEAPSGAGAMEGGDLLPAAHLCAYWRPLVVCLGLGLFQQFSGINAIVMYTTQILREANVADPEGAALVLMGAQVILTALACVLVERAGRRPLLLFGSLSMAVAHFARAYYMLAFLVGASAPLWVPPASLLLFLVGFSLALGPIPWLILAELFPVHVRGRASSLVAATTSLGSFLVTLFFEPLQDAVTPYVTYLIFGTICLACSVFVHLLVPETKPGAESGSALGFLPVGGSVAAREARLPPLAAELEMQLGRESARELLAA